VADASIPSRLTSRTTSSLAHSLELLFQTIELVIVEPFELNELWPRSGRASDELVDLQLQRSRVTVLGVLQQERDRGRRKDQSHALRVDAYSLSKDADLPTHLILENEAAFLKHSSQFGLACIHHGQLRA
jgi:hypothetical protein